MNALIIEDEKVAQTALSRTVRNEFPDINIVGMTSSVQESVTFLKNLTGPLDIIFMDVELSDGDCFEIFRQTEVDAKVIMTTAYDSYAIKAFEAGSVDYLLKPIDVKDLRRAVERCRKNTTNPDIAALLEAFRRPARERFIVKFNDRIVPVKTSEIAYFYSEDKYNYLVTTGGAVYIADRSLDEIAEELDPHSFFKISRSCIVSLGAIISITKLVGGRPKPSFDMVVSRSRSDDFLTWLER